MKFKEVLKRLSTALERFVEVDRYLLVHDLSE
jgi:hypothetical protein